MVTGKIAVCPAGLNSNAVFLGNRAKPLCQCVHVLLGKWDAEIFLKGAHIAEK